MFGSNLKKIRNTKSLTMDEAVKKINTQYKGVIHINKGNLSRWENDKAEPMLSTVRVLADFYGLSVDDLVNGNFGNDLDNDIINIYNRLEKERQEKVYNFAEQQWESQNKVTDLQSHREKREKSRVALNSALSAGTGIIDLDPEYTEEVEFDGYVPKHDLAFKVTGDSMKPTFRDGEIVFVEKTPDIHNGQFIAVQINDEAFIKKVYIEDNQLRLVSLNKQYNDIIADGNDVIRVIGRIIL